jgi:hypothetical protein
VFAILVPTLVAVTVTPGIRAPEASDTLPPTVAFTDWPNPVTARSKQQTSAARMCVVFGVIPTLLNFSCDPLKGDWNLYQPKGAVKKSKAIETQRHKGYEL